MCFLIKNPLMMTKLFIYIIDFLNQIEILQLNILKLSKYTGVSSFFFKIS